MSQNNSSIWGLVVLLGFLCLLMGVLIGFGVGTLKEGKCVRNPLDYGISKFESEGLEIECQCYFNQPNYSPFFFNETGIFPFIQ